MAVLRKRGKTYILDFRVDGKRVRQSVGNSKRLAELALKDVEVRLAKQETGFYIKAVSITDFLEEYSRFSVSTHTFATVRRYKAIIDHFEDFLKTKLSINRLSQLNSKLFDDYKMSRRQEYQARNTGRMMFAKTNTINMELRTLRTILYKAVEWGYLTSNPLKNVKLLKVTDAKPYRFLSREEIDLLLRNSTEALRPIFFTFLNTGMRLSELIYLQWKDVDLLRSVIKIQPKEDWQPKTGSREIPLNQETAKLLSNLKRTNRLESTFVFHDRNGKRLKRDLREDLIRVTKRSGFPDVTKIHSLRHTFASQLVMSGVDLPTVMKLMGHTDIQTTMIYAHLAPDHLVDAVNKLSFGNGGRN